MTEQRKPKRKRGGQPGNTNARKHGLYADRLTPEQMEKFWEAAGKGSSLDKTFIDIKVRDAFVEDPCNPRVLEDCTRILTRFYAAYFHLENEEIPELRRHIRGMFLYLVKNFADCPGTNQAQNGAFVSDSPERIESDMPIPIPFSASEKQEDPTLYFENEYE